MIFSLLKRLYHVVFDTHHKTTQERIRLLEKMINAKINNADVFIEALTHRSMVDGKRFRISNERLEFLGDAVLGFIVGRELYYLFPDKDEGYLTKTRANFVNKNALYEAGQRINILRLIFIQNELLNNERFGKKTVVSDALESLIGAIYLDCGMEVASKFINCYIIEPNMQNKLHLIDENYKSQLLEYAQAMKMEIPKYFVIQEEGPEHDRIFTVEVRLGINVLGSGKGKSKKAAEQEAAHSALSKIIPPELALQPAI